MIKSHQHFFNFIQVLLDGLTVGLSLLLAYWIRFSSPFYPDWVRVLNVEDYLRLAAVIIPVYLILYAIFGLYKPFRTRRFYREGELLFLADTSGILFTVSWLFLTKNIYFSRLMLGYFYIFTILFTIGERFMVRYILKKLRSKGYNLQHIMVVGAGALGQQFARKAMEEKQLGYQITGYVDDYYPKEDKDGIPILGTTRELDKILEKHRVDEVVIALPNTSQKRINEVIDICEFQGIKTQVIPDYFALIQGSRPSFDELDGIPLINTRYIPLDNPWKNGLKRFFDIVFSLLVLIILSPLLLVTAIGVKVTSPGPVIYKQTRIGLNRKEFEIYKFRSMRNDVPQVGEQGWTTEDDPRKTKFGTFIRKTSIDELPQFVNVLKGDMSVVGPRPERPYWVNQFKEEVPHYMIKHHVRPGLTGLAQVEGWRGDTSIEERIKADIRYIENWSPWLDIKIMFRTPAAMMKTSY
ncbi:MAG: undecaprenyl-phosphate glucose phosphotransferase [Eubacteriaceae bacterium]|jgi:Undecaprenyl-phosphate glucose phosphotransferase